MELALWRDIALVWLALLCFIGLVIPLAVMLFAVKGMHVAVDRTPRLLRQLQGNTRAIRTQVDAASRRAAEPVLQARKHQTRVATVMDRMFSREQSQQKGDKKQ